MIFRIKKSGFTLIELLFVIVITGIVGGIALQTIKQYYDGVYRMGEYNKRVMQADHILEIIGKYFENAIGSSIINLDQEGNATGCYGPPEANDIHDYTIAFVSVDMDSLKGINGKPGWSEETRLIDNNISAFDSNYTHANTIINSFGSSLVNSSVYNDSSLDINACNRFNWDGMGVGGGSGFHQINSYSDTSLALDNAHPIMDGKRKYLIRTAYAFKVSNDGNFTMYSGFRPWLNENYTAAANRNLLAENVAHFYIDYDANDFITNPDLNDRGLVWRLKVCMRGLDANLSLSTRESQTICRERRVHVRF